MNCTIVIFKENALRNWVSLIFSAQPRNSAGSHWWSENIPDTAGAIQELNSVTTYICTEFEETAPVKYIF